MSKKPNSFPYPPLSDDSTPPPSSAPSVPGRISPSASEISISPSRKTTAVQPDEDSIRVVVRLRPLNTLERQRSDGQVTHAADDQQTITKQVDGKPEKPMTFHRAFPDVTSQEQVFEECGVKTLIARAMEGYNATIFAYGQTGSGKTFTITGPEDVKFSEEDIDRWGIVPRSLRYLFHLINERQAAENTKFTVHASYLEIYNEQVQDLLNTTNSSLPVRWTREKQFYVENLFVVECEVLDDCIAVLEEGLKNRTIGSHRLNEHSSRSHGLMTVTIDCETVDPDDQRVITKTGKISFVDLAGSEKVKESRATGDTLVETLNINKSLLTLGNCISALADMKKKPGTIHVPYRDSKLTKLLCDSLGGSGMALMIACCSPSGMNVNETLNTLRYASRAKRIQNRPVIKMDAREELIMNLKKELKAVKAENDNLRQIMASNRTDDNMSQKLVDENKQMKTRFEQLKNNEEKWQRERGDLIKENERLIGKMERLLEIFGTSLDHLDNLPKDMNPLSKVPSTARLFLLSRRASQNVGPEQQKQDQKQSADKKKIDRSLVDISIVTPPEKPKVSSPVQKAPETKPKSNQTKLKPLKAAPAVLEQSKQKDKLKQEVDKLEQEILKERSTQK